VLILRLPRPASHSFSEGWVANALSQRQLAGLSDDVNSSELAPLIKTMDNGKAISPYFVITPVKQLQLYQLMLS